MDFTGLTYRFRTQDTKASRARKLNKLLATPLPAADYFREVPQTPMQWQLMLNAAVRDLVADGYDFDGQPLLDGGPLVFRTRDSGPARTRKLNVLSAVIDAGNA